MPWNLHLPLIVFALTPPSWLTNYPNATATVRSSESAVESSYTTSAQTEEIVQHYGTLFRAAGLPFEPNSDGLGTSIRASAQECDLLIQIRSHDDGASVNVNCSSKVQPQSTPTQPTDIKVLTSRPQPSHQQPTRAGVAPQIPADWMAEHQRKVAEMGIHREHHDAPAPPLVWPSWLTHVNGSAVHPESGVDQSKNAMLKARYVTRAPMTEIYDFYVELLRSHEYPTTSRLSTGQTMSGIKQNALGSVEGSNYPDGAPGASSEIRISFDRDVLNGPITVSMRFTTHEYIASRGY